MDFDGLRQQGKGWREHEGALLQIRGSLQRDSRSVRWIFEAAEENRLVFENHLFVRFGVKADAMEVVEGFKPPVSLRGKKDLILSGALYEFYSGVLEVQEDLLKRRAENQAARLFPKFRRKSPYTEDSYEWAAREVLALFEELVAVFYEIWSVNSDLLRTRSLMPREKRHARELREWAEQRLVAFMDTKVNTNVNRRLRDFLEETRRGTGLSSWQQKVVELAAVTPTAFAKREEGEPIRPGTGKTSVVSRASGLIEEMGSEQALRPERFDTDIPEVGAEDEERLENEDREAYNQYVDYLADEANLSKRERQAFELHHKEQLEYDEIAARMGTEVKTASNQVRTAEKKVGEAVVR